MSVFKIEHSFVNQRIGQLRARPDNPTFRQYVRDLCRCLTYEATRNFTMCKKEIECWSGPVEIEEFASNAPTAVPILRAGLGMLPGFLDIFPDASVSMVGLFRNEETLEPVGYYHNFVNDINSRMAFILDPMLATGGSVNASVKLLKEAGCTDIYGLFLMASEQGIKNVHDLHPEVKIYTCAIDPILNDKGYILPGIGDAGDLIFGT